jgi:hypothetical protein
MVCQNNMLILHVLATLLLLFPTVAAWNASLPVIQLPRTQVQLICEFDIRSTLNVSDLFNAFYEAYLPGISDTQLRTSLEISAMSDIPAHKWYYPSCDLESQQVLATMEIDGFAQFQAGNYTTSLVDQILSEAERPLSMQDFFEANACENMTSWRSHVQEDWNPNFSLKEGNDISLAHSIYFLCGGSDQLYYNEEDEPDGGFLILGMVIGIVMVLMIVGELQQYENRSRPRRATGRRQEDSRAPTYEFEMV